MRRLLRERLSVLAVAPAHGDAALAALAARHAFVAEAFVPVAVPHWPPAALRAVASAVLGGAADEADPERALLDEAERAALASALARVHLHARDAPDARGPAWRPPPGNEGFCLLAARLGAALASRVAAVEREIEQLRRAAAGMRASHLALQRRGAEGGAPAEAEAANPNPNPNPSPGPSGCTPLALTLTLTLARPRRRRCSPSSRVCSTRSARRSRRAQPYPQP